ncbi:hypothetical protein M9H77_22117 [Catharanthus roseus]|uniref:Uncharacterized protein n=1 Tax=Catharanthus roseus TaxID=4058 RepID=A0ACC0AQG9_CATRO|nr:hypothetical protein M9H77_22117 [Catharanthus roseus]
MSKKKMCELADRCNKKNQKKPEEEQKQLTNDTDTNTNNKKKRKHKEVAIYGNYRNYYGYRIDRDLEEDPRLKVMKKEWFEGKDCLDIGCNSGVITISIARKFGCRSILGVDIDLARVEDAYRTLRKIVNSITRKLNTARAIPSKKEANGSKNDTTELASECQSEIINSDSVQGKSLFDIISFQEGDFVQSWRPPESTSYHAILCLSVSKWIHLNCGDDGLINLFSKVWRLLQPGGVFVLEPQPWTSYSKNRRVSETASVNYQNIQIGPEEFQDILLDKVGFRTVENLTHSLSGSKTGFERPILAFWK